MFLDIGLAQAALGLDARIAIEEDFIAINAEAIAEQLVAQELRANSSSLESSSLYYWTRDKRSSSAVVDMLYQYGSKISPIEVKSGATGVLYAFGLSADMCAKPCVSFCSAFSTSMRITMRSLSVFAIAAMKSSSSVIPYLGAGANLSAVKPTTS